MKVGVPADQKTVKLEGRQPDSQNKLENCTIRRPEELSGDDRLSEIEKCVVLLQMFTFVGDDLYEENIKNYSGTCNRTISERFLKENASFIEY